MAARTRPNPLKTVLIAALAVVAAVILLQIVGIGLRLLLGGCVFLSWILPPFWVARDARKRGVENPMLWVVFVLLTWFVGLVVYLMLRPQEPVYLECEGCGKSVKYEFAACPYCGHDLRPRISRCPSCKRLIDREWSFCPYCKTELPG